MQRGCMKNAALVLAQKTFPFQRKLNFNFTQKNFFSQNCVCKMVDPKFETEFWPIYWVSSGGWWLYGLVYSHRISGGQEKKLNWLLILNMLGFINKSKILTFFQWWLRPRFHSSLRPVSRKQSCDVVLMLKLFRINVKYSIKKFYLSW